MQLYETDHEDDAPIEVTLEQLMELREACTDLIEVADSAKALKNNKDFQKVVMESYIDKEPKRLGSLIASGRMPPAAMEGAIADLKSIGNFINFLNDAVSKGEIARSELAATEQAYNESIEASE